METFAVREFFFLPAVFIDYLWGMETARYQFGFVDNFSFIDYLWGMETLLHPQSSIPCALFIDYLWGMETTDELFKKYDS